MPIFRIRTIAATDGLDRTVRSDLSIEAPTVAAARRQADAIADAEALWSDGDIVELLDNRGRLISINDGSWRSDAARLIDSNGGAAG
jgi:hypothetical protein